ncbi:phage tail protein [Aquamicrobium sp.]|uniref:phage tail protein n=1 Tax=Aquamicrobium sp. TaxID=1872579 RepID=UPI00258656E0|nr:phage tail protein [Aquamicrobium sp.]MCK9549643.1 phage tail protein [Aquamicrobium sp.]
MGLFQLGTFTFHMRSLAPHLLSRADMWRWEETPRLSGEAALQFLGRGAGELTLEATLYPGRLTGHDDTTVETIRTIASAGQPLPLIRGDFRMIGWYSIASVEEEHSYMDRSGRPRRAGVILSLLRFGAEGPGTGVLGYFR